MLRKFLLIILLLLAPSLAFAQIFNQNQLIITPYGGPGWIVSTTTSGGTKLQASSTPFFANFFAGTGNVGTLTVTSCTGCTPFAWPFTPQTYGNSTSSIIGFLGGLFSIGSTTIGTLHLGDHLQAETFRLTEVGDPTADQDAVTLAYFNANTPTGFQWKQSVRLATAAALPANTYSNGVLGVGATLTATGNGALSVDGIAVVANNRILVKNESATENNGIYSVTQVGSAILPYILTRTSDYNQASEMLAGDAVAATAGSTNNETFWVQTDDVGTVGTDSVAFQQFAINYTFGDGLTITGSDVDCDTASGTVFGCLAAADWTTFNNKVATTRALTILGTANQITSSAGAQDLSADRTWTLSLPNHVIFPGDFQATNSTTTNATTTSLNVLGQVDIDGLTSALILTGTGGILAEYGGAAACTNQFVTALSALGASTCASINNDQWSGTDLSVANGGTGASTLTGLLQGNGTGAITAVTGTAGQFPYFNGTNTLLATSTLFLSTASYVGIGSTTPYAMLSVTNTSANPSFVVEDSASPDTTPFIIDASGKVGIGTTSAPVSTLHVGGPVTVQGAVSVGTGNAMVLADNAGQAQIWALGPNISTSGSFTFVVARSDLSNSAQVVTMNTSGQMGILNASPNVALDVIGDIEYTGTITDVSDERLKENFTPLTSNLAKLTQLAPLSYNMIGDTRLQLGFTAQNVQTVFPNVVSVVDPENGYLGLDYTQLIAPAIGAIQELNAKIEKQQKTITSLEERIKKLEQRLGY